MANRARTIVNKLCVELGGTHFSGETSKTVVLIGFPITSNNEFALIFGFLSLHVFGKGFKIRIDLKF